MPQIGNTWSVKNTGDAHLVRNESFALLEQVLRDVFVLQVHEQEVRSALEDALERLFCSALLEPEPWRRAFID